ncbi:MAG: metal-dependent hydrolase [Acidimicrobiia bacterium]|nr:metal-dependent hydrolase [Acidimicrobiia bacterium]
MLSPRRVTFDYSSQSSPIWTPARPEFSCAANSVSLMMPIIEPYFVRSARRALPLLPPDLATTAQAYLEQEAEHLRQHRLFNRMLTDRYPALQRTERTMGAVYRWLERSRSLAFSCAFAAASETMAYSAARWAADRRSELFRDADEVVSTLFLWHLAEEVEHKSAAFEIHRRVADVEDRPVLARLRLVASMLVALALVVVFVVWGTTVMLAGERRLHHPIAWFRLLRWSLVFAFELLGNLTVSLLPGFHPDDFVDPLFYEVWLREFDAATGTVPIWVDVPMTAE